MAEFKSQGEIAIGGTVLHTGVKNNSKLYIMRFFNPAAYTIQLFSYQSSTATTVQIFDFTLDAGDVITDNFLYLLQEGDYLEIFTNVVGTKYTITGFDN
jgi:hypothetical protein